VEARIHGGNRGHPAMQRRGLHMHAYASYSGMTDRTRRHSALRDLVQSRDLATQHELLDELAAAGLEVHQSTLSRDLDELGIRKVGGRYVLEPPEAGAAGVEVASDVGPARPVVLGFTECGPNLITVRVGTGQAQLLGVLLDRMDDSPIAGTIAGDDTVLVVTAGRTQQRAAARLLERSYGAERHVAG